MDSIEFKLESYDYRNFGRQDGVVPVVNGVPLRDLVRTLHGNLLGQHAGMQTGLRSHEIAGFGPGYFLGQSKHRLWRKKNTIGVLACGCGVTECWTLETPVQVSTDKVIWPSFVQPDRPKLDYSQLGAFTFDRDSYDAAVDDLEGRLGL